NGNHATGASTAAPRAGVVDSTALMADLGRLADDSLRGRLSGTPENAKARDFIAARFDRLGLGTVGAGRTQPFTFVRRRDSATVNGANVIGVVRGTALPDRYVVVTAHFDHVGAGRPVDGDSIYNGADDNASGTAALLALAEHFVREPARHSLLLVALDAEEQGLQGARAFLAHPPVPKEAMVLNVNMDMVSNSVRGELYAAGAAKWPQLRAPLERVARDAPVKLLLGHDTPEPTPRDDWTMQSDQGVFHQAGIPFVYFGVEDHPYYHQPSDEVRTITPGFYVGAVRTIARAIRELDRL
ncbi:MAG TPA: M20/M25/M40 family metallo-hydrolase, partial [Gemmatimonadaceae bacterium]|nr:M20/M25/M40 family metallo-hydrolase [Gemmatimonadaceae bacterium]